MVGLGWLVGKVVGKVVGSIGSIGWKVFGSIEVSVGGRQDGR